MSARTQERGTTARTADAVVSRDIRFMRGIHTRPDTAGSHVWRRAQAAASVREETIRWACVCARARTRTRTRALLVLAAFERLASVQTPVQVAVLGGGERREGGDVALAGELGLVLLPPGGEAVEEAELVLGGLVEGHLVLVFAALLREGADALVHPLVAVDLGATRGVLLLLALLRLGMRVVVGLAVMVPLSRCRVVVRVVR